MRHVSDSARQWRNGERAVSADFVRRVVASSIWLAAITLYLMQSFGQALAAVTDLSTVPLATATPSVVKPNLMFVLDDSGSMAWDYLPDNVNDNNTCKPQTACTNGMPPFYAGQFNGVYYNPQITYSPPVNADGTSKAAQGTPWTAVKVDGFGVSSTSTTNLITGFPEIVYCNTSSTTTADLSNPLKCKRNGIDTTNPFNYQITAGTSATGYPDATFKNQKTKNGTPFYFVISPVEHCSDYALNNCVAATVATAANPYPAPVRFCNSTANATAAVPVSGGNKCQARFDSASGYIYPRYGSFKRTDIVSTTTSYGPFTYRADCAARTTCTYAEEMTNFANWYAYYSNRMNMMKSSAGRAFLPLDNRYRIGFITINPGAPVASSNYLAINTFDAAQKTAWYNMFYAQVPGSSTPLRTALSRVGRHYAGKQDGINSGMTGDPIQYSCQQNFTILTTDGYWNDNTTPVQINGTTVIGDQDNVNQTVAPIYSSRATGTYDGGVGGGNTLADVAMYYYKTDLRSAALGNATGALGSDVSANNVLATTLDFATHQHMTTFTLGLASGLMTYQAGYETAATGDFANIKAGTNNGCDWVAGVCNWPVPAANAPSTLDDLWHAAVNGRGSFYSARDPQSLSDGLAGALAGVSVRAGGGAAAATSTPNITQTDNRVYGSSYRSGKWDGDVTSEQIDPATGAFIPGTAWSAQALLDARVQAAADTRTIYTFSSGGASHLKSFDWASLSVAEQAYFSNKCSLWSQCTVTNLTAPEIVIGNGGQNLVEYLRGQYQYDQRATNASQVFRTRDHVLGDAINAKPVFVKVPQNSFADAVTPTYDSFKTANATRQGMVYVAANDGMLHAFNTDTGAETWAYVPKMVMPNLYKLAEVNYASNHQYFVDGSPEVMDIFDATASAWKTILVGGLGGGGRGYYALDITNPAAPQALWEICSDSTLCGIADTDMGYSYGNPVITKRASDGRWVVILSSGYNNVAPGTGHGILYVLDALTGAVLNKVDTGTGNTTTPSGLAKFSVWADDASRDNTGKWVYGGDLNGDVWRFDLTTATPTVVQIAALRDAVGAGQPVTVRPDLGLVNSSPVVFVGTGRFLGTSDLTNTQQQSLYAFRDTAANLGNLRGRADMVVQTLTQTSATTRTGSNNAVDWAVKKGWYVDFNPGNASPGERVNIDPILVNGTLLVFTNIPTSSACTVGGESWLYQFNYASGAWPAPVTNQQVGGKISSSLTAGATVVMLPDGTIKAIVTDASGNKAPVNVNASGGGSVTGRRVSLRELTP